jgi:hypothetical protein
MRFEGQMTELKKERYLLISYRLKPRVVLANSEVSWKRVVLEVRTTVCSTLSGKIFDSSSSFFCHFDFTRLTFQKKTQIDARTVGNCKRYLLGM